MNKYQCIFGFETDTKTYVYGDIISREDYETLTASEQRFFILNDLKYAIL